MGNPYPIHTCTVSPFDSYHSNVVNRLTRLVSNYENCIFSADKIDVSLVTDSTSEIDISSGSFFKDDVFISISECTVDMADGDYYLSPGVGGYWNEQGYYYIVFHYVYEKARPAPRPSIRILLPSQRDQFATGPYVFLKAVLVHFVGSQFCTISLHDSDPENPTVKRIYSKLYLALEDSMPDFSVERDYGRLIMVRNDDGVYYGTSTNWATLLGGGGGGGANPLDLAQLAEDMYAVPVLNHNGIGILNPDLETQLVNLRQYVGAADVFDIDPNYTSITTLLNQGINLTVAASRLDAETDYLRIFIGKSGPGNIPTAYSSTYIISNSDSLVTASSKLDDIAQKIKNYTGKPDNTSAMPVYTSITSITQTGSLKQAISELDLETNYIRSFIGKNAKGVETPVYTSIRSIVQNSSLESALSALDLSIGYTDLVKVVTDNSTTPSILSSGKVCGLIRLENTVSTSITDFLDVPVGSNSAIFIVLAFGNGNTTIKYNLSYIVLNDQVDFVGTLGDILVLVNYSGVWYEASRSGVSSAIFNPEFKSQFYEEFISIEESTGYSIVSSTYVWESTLYWVADGSGKGGGGGYYLPCLQSVSGTGGLVSLTRGDGYPYVGAVVYPAGQGNQFIASKNPLIRIRQAQYGTGTGIRFVGLTDEAFSLGSPANGIYFRHTAGGNYIAVCRSSDIESTLDTNISASNGVFHALKLVVSGTSSVAVWVDGSYKGSITTRIPSVNLSFQAGIDAGTVQTTGLYLDYVNVVQNR